MKRWWKPRKCRRVERLISFYALGETNEEESKLIEEHVKICPDCAKALEDDEKLTSLIRSLEKTWTDEDKEVISPLPDKPPTKWSYHLGKLRRLASHPLVASLIILAIFQSFYIGETLQDKPRKLTQREMKHIKGGSIPPTSILKTSPWNTLSTALDNKNRLKINRNTYLKIWEGNKEYTLKLEKGEVWLSCEDNLKKFKVETPLGKVEAKEAEFYVKLDKEERIIVTVNYGSVLFSTNNGESIVGAGTQSFATLKTSPSEPEDITIHKATEWVRW
jgi:hypothetical protein